ncbi:MAG TPA: WxcM-like domain-containing protein [Casimicrobiaceae bacterium]|nr:WxcM-like domain-containing protein [Casimicrobiaceae bacterium]
MTIFVHPHALCESVSIGDGTRVSAFAHVLAGARVGANCDLGDHVLVEEAAVIGDRVSIGSGVRVPNGVRIEDDVSVGSNAAFADDWSKSARTRGDERETLVRRGASIGANAAILRGVTVGEQASVAAGALVARSVPPNAIVEGNPAHIIGYVDLVKADAARVTSHAKAGVVATHVEGVTLHEMLLVHDMRGDLSAGEFERHVPFAVRRYFMVFDVPSEDVRGEHAHRTCHQFLLCARGRCHVVVDNGRTRAEVELDRPNLGLYLPAMVWGIQYRHSADALLLVFASDYYDPADYIRDYGEFLSAVNARDAVAE